LGKSHLVFLDRLMKKQRLSQHRGDYIRASTRDFQRHRNFTQPFLTDSSSPCLSSSLYLKKKRFVAIVRSSCSR
jgi:hypothetical protein